MNFQRLLWGGFACIACLLLIYREDWATLIALIALVGALEQAAETRRQNVLLVRPLLAIVTHANLVEGQPGLCSYRVELQNNGLGPAIIESFSLLVGDCPTLITDPAQIAPILRKELEHDFYAELGLFAYRKGHAIKAGDSVPVGEILIHHPAKFASDDVEKAAAQQKQRIERMGFLIRYKSMAGEEQPAFDSRNFKAENLRVTNAEQLGWATGLKPG